MNLSPEGWGVVVLIAVMTVVTLVTRFAGPFIMSYFTINRRLESFINSMAGSVLIALIAPMALEGDWGARLALLATAVVMLTLRKPLPSIAAGIATAAITRLLMG
ncbi:AzlD domain-containing protein [Marinobacteraceae bacterium S3BR75-40.1]